MKIPKVTLDTLHEVSSKIHPKSVNYDQEWADKITDDMFNENPRLVAYLIDLSKHIRGPISMALATYLFIKTQMEKNNENA